MQIPCLHTYQDDNKKIKNGKLQKNNNSSP